MGGLLSLKKGRVCHLIAHTILYTPLAEVKKKQSRQTRNPNTVTRQKATTKATMKDIRPREVILKEGGHQHSSNESPIFATITVAVCHCGAGCVLGDIVGEWLVYGTGATINGRMLWVEYLVAELHLASCAP